jgi:SAM-dependent methyltransferase
MVGVEGSDTGVDMTPEMIAKARVGAGELAVRNVEFVESEAERLPFAAESFGRRHLQRGDRPDPGQGRCLRRALPRPAARRSPPARRRHDPAVSEEGRRNIDLWTG